MHRPVPRLVLVIDCQRSRWPVLELAKAAAAGGVDAIYLRDAGGDSHQTSRAPLPAAGRGVGVRVSERLELRVLCQNLAPTVTILVNQPWDRAWPANVGLHLRERDPIPDWTARDTPRPTLVGRSVHSPESAAVSTNVDYVLAGHIFPSPSKPGKLPLGLGGLARIVTAAPCPVIAIGGITAERIAEVLRAGAHGVAVIGAISEATDPYLATRSLRAAIDNARVFERKEPSMQSTDITTPTGTAFEIVVNGKPITVPEQSTIHDFLASKRMTGAMAIVERNGEIVPRGDYATTRVTPGDTIEVVHAVGGG